MKVVANLFLGVVLYLIPYIAFVHFGLATAVAAEWLSYDDGVSDTYCAPFSSYPGSEVRLMFHYPDDVIVKRVMFYVPKAGLVSAPFRVKFYTLFPQWRSFW